MRALSQAILFAAALHAADFRTATIVAPASLSVPEQNAARMLAEEIQHRTRIRLPIPEAWPADGPVIFLGQESHLRVLHPLPVMAPTAGAEGYRLEISGSTILVLGNDARGTLFGAGALLRRLHMDRDSLDAPDSLQVAFAPKYALRGHQLGYRPKTNSYDGWDVRTWEQYIRDLVVFGTNAIELIPPRSDDAADSPLFPLPPMQMMIEQSPIAASYGLDVWIWHPAMDRDYSDPKTVDFALHEWGEVFRQLPRVDAVFVPGLEQRMAAIRRMPDEAARLKALSEIVHWTDPGPGGFYDDLGNLARQPHLVRGPGPAKDPAFLQSSLVGLAGNPAWRISWRTDAETLYETPLHMHYDWLDPAARYKIRVVYAGDSPRVRIRLAAGNVEIHPFLARPQPIAPVEFDIPPSATANGMLDLSWTREPGAGGNGRGCQVAEVWIIKK